MRHHPREYVFANLCNFLVVRICCGRYFTRKLDVSVDKLLGTNFICKCSTRFLFCFNLFSTDELRGLEWNIRYQIIKGICEGLQYLHNEMGIIHMDLKPANILVKILVQTDDMVPKITGMVPKITDFGLARLVENNYTMGVPFVSR